MDGTGGRRKEGRKEGRFAQSSVINLPLPFAAKKNRRRVGRVGRVGRQLKTSRTHILSLSLSLNGGLALFSRPTQLTGGAGAATLLICAFLVDRLFAPCRYCASCFRPLSVSSSSNSYCEATLCRSALVECNPTKPISRDGLKSAPWVAYIFCLALPGSCSAKQVHFLGRVSTQYRVTRYP